VAREGFGHTVASAIFPSIRFHRSPTRATAAREKPKKVVDRTRQTDDEFKTNITLVKLALDSISASQREGAFILKQELNLTKRTNALLESILAKGGISSSGSGSGGGGGLLSDLGTVAAGIAGGLGTVKGGLKYVSEGITNILKKVGPATAEKTVAEAGAGEGLLAKSLKIGKGIPLLGDAIQGAIYGYESGSVGEGIAAGFGSLGGRLTGGAAGSAGGPVGALVGEVGGSLAGAATGADAYKKTRDNYEWSWLRLRWVPKNSPPDPMSQIHSGEHWDWLRLRWVPNDGSTTFNPLGTGIPSQPKIGPSLNEKSVKTRVTDLHFTARKITLKTDKLVLNIKGMGSSTTQARADFSTGGATPAFGGGSIGTGGTYGPSTLGLGGSTSPITGNLSGGGTPRVQSAPGAGNTSVAGGGVSAKVSSATVSQNKQYFLDALNKGGITDPQMRAAMAAVAEGESHFGPHSETGYQNTSNARIRSVFGSRLSGYSDDQITQLKKDQRAFFNAVYGGRLGNASDDGYQYRGRGYFQLTGKGNYAKYGKMIGVDLVNNPDLANDPRIAARIAVAYMNDRYASAPGSSVYEKTARAVGRAVASTEAVKMAAYGRYINSGEFAPGKIADLSFESKSQGATRVGNGSVSAAVDSVLKLKGKDDAHDDALLKKYMSDGGVGMDPHDLAWCAATVDSALSQQGIRIPRLPNGRPDLMARSYANWGTSVEPKNTQKGDVLEFKDGSHVGFATGNTRIGPNGQPQVELLAGNENAHMPGLQGPGRSQVGMVNTRFVDADQVNIRRAGAEDLPTQELLAAERPAPPPAPGMYEDRSDRLVKSAEIHDKRNSSIPREDLHDRHWPISPTKPKNPHDSSYFDVAHFFPHIYDKSKKDSPSIQVA
jgi:predicted chitinase